MIGVAIVAFFVIAAVISALGDWALGLFNFFFQYDWHTERWVFVPTRYDVALDIMIRS